MISERRHEHVGEPTGHGACWASIHRALAPQDAETDARLIAYLAREKAAKAAGIPIGCSGERIEDRTSPLGKRQRIPPEARARVRKLREDGMTLTEIGKLYGVGREAVRRAVRGLPNPDAGL